MFIISKTTEEDKCGIIDTGYEKLEREFEKNLCRAQRDFGADGGATSDGDGVFGDRAV